MHWTDIILSASNKPYVLGEHDCLRVACAVVAAQTGIDYWPQFAGYKTRREALVTILRIAPTLREAVTKTLGVEPVAAALAQRGGIVLFNDGVLDHLGVCLGGEVGVLGPEGMLRVRITDPRNICAWRVGQCQPQ